MTPPPVTFPGVVCGLTTVVAGAVLLAGLVSVSLPLTLAVLVTAPVVTTDMCTTISKLTLELGTSVPKLQVTVPAVLVHPAPAETKLTWAGSTSVTVPPLEMEGPLLVTTR